MNIAAWHEAPIGKRHDRETFDCGETALKRLARHDVSSLAGRVLRRDSSRKALAPFVRVARGMKCGVDRDRRLR